MRRSVPRPGFLPLLLALLVLAPAWADEGDTPHGKGPRKGPGGEPPWVRNRREAKDKMGGLPAKVLAQQSAEPFTVPTVDAAAALALAAAAKRAEALIDRAWHTGRTLYVPAKYPTIQAAIDAAQPRDIVEVAPGTYYGLLVMKDGVKLVSAAGSDGDERIAVTGAKLKLPRRTLRTILDGSRSKPSSHGLIDFLPGTGRHTIVDGFTLQNLPHQNHHRPGHAHGVNVRGASPIVMHCVIQDNGSTGIGNHVVYKDQKAPLAKRDFRVANVAHGAEAVIFDNIVRRNLGRGIGCNHLSAPFLLGNEVSANDDTSLGEGSGPGIGMKHGATPTILGNLVHHNPGGGIVCKKGAPQGAFPIDRPTQPTYERNVAWANGKERPQIGASGAGDQDHHLRIVGNWVFDAGTVGIGLRDGTWALVEGNLVARTAAPGISILGSTVPRLVGNRIADVQDVGIAIVQRARVHVMRDNAAQDITGPRFAMRDSIVGIQER